MSFDTGTRASDSPYVEAIMHGYTVGNGSTIRPAECHWHMVFTKFEDNLYPIFVGPLTASGTVSFTEGAEILWIKFKLGTFMPHLPHRNFLDVETVLPEATSKTFWLKGSAWQFPNYENVDTFVDWLVREEVLVYDPVVSAVLEGQPHDMASRTVRHRFLRATGLTQTHIFQIERAQRAAAFLSQGVSILDTVYEVGYFDQPHLTRSLKQWVGHTPAEILRTSNACRFVQDSDLSFEYHADVLANTG
jgi:AraC-like DNA-binding protein